MALLQIFPQLSNFSLALLIQLHLSRSRATRLVQAVAETLHLPSKIRSLPLRLGPGLPLGLQLLLELLNMGLVLLDGLLALSSQALLVIKLGEEDAGVLLLALDDGLLDNLRLTLNRPPLHLQVGAATLLLLQRGLQLVQGAHELALDLVEMSHFVLGGGQILSGLGCVLADVLLLLVQLVDGGPPPPCSALWRACGAPPPSSLLPSSRCCSPW